MNSVTIVRKFEQEQVADREPAPEAPEALVDQPRVADAGDRAEPDDHLLVDDQHRDQQQQHPQQARAVVLAGLRVGRDAAGVVVADHHDQARADDREQRQRPRAPAAPARPRRAGGSSRRRPGCRRRGRCRAPRARASAASRAILLHLLSGSAPPRRAAAAVEALSRSSGSRRRRDAAARAPRDGYFAVVRRLRICSGRPSV